MFSFETEINNFKEIGAKQLYRKSSPSSLSSTTKITRIFFFPVWNTSQKPHIPSENEYLQHCTGLISMLHNAYKNENVGRHQRELMLEVSFETWDTPVFFSTFSHSPSIYHGTANGAVTISLYLYFYCLYSSIRQFHYILNELVNVFS